MTPYKALLAALCAVVLSSPPASAFNGAIARALPVENITVDGDLSDWPPDAERWPLARVVYGEALRDSADFQGSFRIGYNAGENAIYVAVSVRDESIVVDTTTAAQVHPGTDAPTPDYDNEYDGCELFIHLAHLTENDRVVLYSIHSEFQRARFYWLGRAATSPTRNVQAAVQRSANGHYYEWRVDIGGLGDGQVALGPGTTLGLDVMAIDKDADGSSSRVAWGPVWAKWLPDRVGAVILAEKNTTWGQALAPIGHFATTVKEHSVDYFKSYTKYQYITTVIPVSFGVLHLLLFLFYPRHRENLYYALAMLSGGLFIFIEFHLYIEIIDLPVVRLFYAMLIVTWLLFLRFFYFLFSDGLPKPFWLFLVAGIALMIEIWTADTIRSRGVVGVFSFIYSLLFSGELLRINIQALRKGEDGAGILCTGAVVFALFLAESALGVMGVIKQSRELTTIMSKAGFLIFIFAMSAYLARRFAHTNIDLEHQLVQVKELSARAMEEEVRRKLVEADNARKTQELEDARQLQLSLLPQTVPELPGLEIAWRMETATEVGGDYYDFSIGDDGTLTLALGDATGHGLQSGNLVVAAKSLFHSLAEQPDLTATFDTMSRNLKSMNFRRLSMAMALVKIRDDRLQISSAAIPPLLLYRAAQREVEEILIGGLPLGASDKARYEQREFALHPGDTLLLMTDGLPERLNDRDEELGYPRTEALFAEIAEQHPTAICEHLARGGEQWADGRPRDDDVTFVVVKIGA